MPMPKKTHALAGGLSQLVRLQSARLIWDQIIDRLFSHIMATQGFGVSNCTVLLVIRISPREKAGVRRRRNPAVFGQCCGPGLFAEIESSIGTKASRVKSGDPGLCASKGVVGRLGRCCAGVGRTCHGQSHAFCRSRLGYLYHATITS